MNGRLGRNLVVAALGAGLSLFAGQTQAVAAPPIRIPAGIVHDAAVALGRTPSTEVASSLAAAMATKAGVSLEVAERGLSTAGQKAAIWSRVRTRVVKQFDLTEAGPVRAAVVATACDMLKGESVGAGAAVTHLEKAYMIQLTKSEKVDLIVETVKLHGELEKALNDPNKEVRIEVLLGCYLAGAWA